MKIRCEFCGSFISDTDENCPNCGGVNEHFSMKIRCEFCGSFISDTDEKCPNCGGVNEHLRTSAYGIPQTIDEMIAFCNSRNIPYEKMRFFLGTDYRGPEAFGIYKDDNDDFVVYKNKSNGSRVIRYNGKDEAYAVNEIYQKMRSELLERKAKYPGNIKPPVKSKKNRKKALIIGIILGVFLILGILYNLTAPNSGYYSYNDRTYYNDGGNWYVYGKEWEKIDEIPELEENYKEYWQGSEYDKSYNVEDFQDSEFYNEDNSNDTWDDDSWDDDDWDYDYDTWDSNDTNWDSDW